MDIEQELTDAANFAHKVTGCSVKRHVSMRAAVEINRLREWIREEGERNNTCTFNVLGEVCGYCECKRKPSNANVSGLAPAQEKTK